MVSILETDHMRLVGIKAKIRLSHKITTRSNPPLSGIPQSAPVWFSDCQAKSGVGVGYHLSQDPGSADIPGSRDGPVLTKDDRLGSRIGQAAGTSRGGKTEAAQFGINSSF